MLSLRPRSPGSIRRAPRRGFMARRIHSRSAPASLVRKKPFLAVQSAAISGQGAIASNDAVTRHDDRNGIGAIRVADGPACLRTPKSLGDLAVTRGFARGNRPERLPDLPLKVRSRRPHVKIAERFGMSLEIRRERCCDARIASSVRQDIAPIMQVQEPTHARLLVQEIQRVQISVGVGDRKDRADRRLVAIKRQSQKPIPSF